MPELRSNGQTRLAAAGVTDVGRTREINEDNILVKRDLDLYVVADGMGGHSAGDVASSIATTSLVTFFNALRDGGMPEVGSMSDTTLTGAAQTLVTAIKKANQEIHSKSSATVQHKGMGSTVVAALVSRDAGQIHIAHVGDSRCYRIRDGEIEQLTRDHSLINEALALKPDLTKAQIARLPKNVITRALGMSAVVQVDVRSEDVRPGDTFLLCSDGLSGLVPEDKMLDIVDIASDIQEACELLVDEANEAGGTDNISALMIRIEDSDEGAAAPKARVYADEATISVESTRTVEIDEPPSMPTPATEHAHVPASESESESEAAPEASDASSDSSSPPHAGLSATAGAEPSPESSPTLAARREDIARMVAEAAEVEISAEAVELGELDEGDEFAGLGFDIGEDEEVGGQEQLDASFADSFVSDYIVESFGLMNDDVGPVSMVRVAHCKSCDFELLIGNKFCVECGARVET